MSNLSGSSNGNLRPEQRMDSNGKLVTRWVKDDVAGNGPSAALAGSTANTSGPSSVPLNQNWATTTYLQAERLASKVAEGASDPDKLWENFDFYTGMLESRFGGLAIESMNANKVTASLRDAWLSKHGFSASDRAGYMHVGGDEGYEAYRDAYIAMTKAAAKAEKHYRPSIMTTTVRDGQAQVDVPFQQILDHTPTQGEREAALRAARNVSARLESRDEPEGKFDAAMERVFGDDAPIGKMSGAIGTILESTLERHSFDTEAPKDVEGTTVSWSDLNPFKRRKK